MVKIFILGMGKRQVKNESALKEIRIPEEGENFKFSTKKSFDRFDFT